MMYTKENPLRVFTAFSGYDSQLMGLDRIKENYPNFAYECVGWAEIDKYAIKAHNAVYPQFADRNFGDISKVDWSQVQDFDLFTYSFPCQDISNAGLCRGLEEGSGTRSALLWECRRAIEEKHPKFLLMENVKPLVGKKNRPNFDKWLRYLESQGYRSYWIVLNAKDYGIPQNRERVFCVSVLEGVYEFPQPFELTKRLKDVLEQNVDEKYYLSDKMIQGFLRHNENHKAKGTGFVWTPKIGEDVANCLRGNAALAATDNSVIVKSSELNDKRLSEMIDGGKIETPQEGENAVIIDTYNQTNHQGVCPTIKRYIDHNNNIRVVEPQMIGYTRDSKGKIVERHLQGYSNTIHQSTGSGNSTDCFVAEPKVTEPVHKQYIPYDDYNQKIPKNVNVIGTLTREAGNPAPRHNYKIIEVTEPVLFVPEATKKGYAEVQAGGVFDASYPTSKTRRGRVIDGGKVSPTLQCNSGSNLNYFEGMEECCFRIRKLTPRECFRLMGVTDENIDKIQQAEISNSQQYKLAGNSIVVDCLYYIYKNMFVNTKITKPIQLSLF